MTCFSRSAFGPARGVGIEGSAGEGREREEGEKVGEGFVEEEPPMVEERDEGGGQRRTKRSRRV